MRRVFITLVWRDITHNMLRGGAAVRTMVFFLISAFLFGLALGPVQMDTTQNAYQIVWILALLSGLLSIDRLFYEDYDDGTLDQLALSPVPLWLTVMAKALSHWAYSALPLLILVPLVGTLLNLPEYLYRPLFISLLLGTPIFSLLASLGSALTLGARRGAILALMVILPFFIPVLIFALSYIEAVAQGYNAEPSLLILIALFLFTAVFSPLAGSLSLRQAIR